MTSDVFFIAVRRRERRHYQVRWNKKLMTSRGFGSGNPNYLVMTETCRDKVLAFNFLKFPFFSSNNSLERR